jgi:hypothetical protein
MRKGELVRSKRRGYVGIVLDHIYDSDEGCTLIKIFASGKISVWIRASWYEAVTKTKCHTAIKNE